MLCVRYRLTSEFAKPPTRGSNDAAGWDVYAHARMTLLPGEQKMVSLGLALEIPRGYYAMLHGRSGLVAKGIIGHTGIIDSDYRGEIAAILQNRTTEDFWIQPGDRVGQLVFAPVLDISWEAASELSETDRGVGGFGSTGK